MTPLPLLLVLISCTLGLFSSPTPTVDTGESSLRNQMLQLEQMVAELQSQSQTQEQKYSAVLSSVLSKLTYTTDELNSVKSELKYAKEELASVKAKVGNNENQISILSKEVNSTSESLSLIEGERTSDLNISSEMMSVKKILNSLNWTIETVQHELGAVTSQMKNVSSKQDNLTSLLTATELNMMAMNESLSDVRPSEPLSPVKEHVFFQMVETMETETVISASGHLVFNSTKYNEGNGYNVTNGLFTAPLGGIYLFWLNAVITSTSSGNVTVNIKSSSTPYLGRTIKEFTQSDKSSTLTVIAVANVAQGEKVWFTTTRRVQYHVFSNYGGVLLHAY